MLSGQASLQRIRIPFRGTLKIRPIVDVEQAHAVYRRRASTETLGNAVLPRENHEKRRCELTVHNHR